MNKSIMTNLFALFFIVISFIVPDSYAQPLFFIGIFAFSGAVTNLLAIHMLFEKIPFLYGSGIIEKNFETFKYSVYTMIMKQFFSKEQLEEFFAKEEQRIDLTPLLNDADFSPAFDALTKTVMGSKFGAAIQMFGGEEALEGLREPFSNKLKSAVEKIVSSETFKAQLHHHIKHSGLSKDLPILAEKLVTKRLNELTPRMVKELIKELINEHLGWLVVWGGFLGGLIGLFSSFFI